MAKLLDFMVRANLLTENDIGEDLLRMADPGTFDSQDEMTEHFEDCLGYDPFTYFDKRSIEDEIETLINTAPYSVQEQLRGKKAVIVDKTLEYSGDLNDAMLSHILASVIKDTIGWSCGTDTTSLDECVSMAVFGDALSETDEEEDDSDDTDDELILDDDDLEDE